MGVTVVMARFLGQLFGVCFFGLQFKNLLPFFKGVVWGKGGVEVSLRTENVKKSMCHLEYQAIFE